MTNEEGGTAHDPLSPCSTCTSVDKEGPRDDSFGERKTERDRERQRDRETEIETERDRETRFAIYWVIPSVLGASSRELN